MDVTESTGERFTSNVEYDQSKLKQYGLLVTYSKSHPNINHILLKDINNRAIKLFAEAAALMKTINLEIGVFIVNCHCHTG